jgi:hypothetical protein
MLQEQAQHAKLDLSIRTHAIAVIHVLAGQLETRANFEHRQSDRGPRREHQQNCT